MLFIKAFRSFLNRTESKEALEQALQEMDVSHPWTLGNVATMTTQEIMNKVRIRPFENGTILLQDSEGDEIIFSVAGYVATAYMCPSAPAAGGFCNYPEGILQSIQITGGGCLAFKNAIQALSIIETHVVTHHGSGRSFVSDVRGRDATACTANAPLVQRSDYNPMLYANIDIPHTVPCKRWLLSLVAAGKHRYTQHNHVKVVDRTADPVSTLQLDRVVSPHAISKGQLVEIRFSYRVENRPHFWGQKHRQNRSNRDKNMARLHLDSVRILSRESMKVIKGIAEKMNEDDVGRTSIKKMQVLPLPAVDGNVAGP